MPKIPFFSRFFGNKQKESQHGVVVGFGYTVGKYIEPTFKRMIQYYLCDPNVKGAIDELAETSVGHGFHLTGKNEQALKIAKDWCEQIDLDNINQNIARELWATGNAFLEKVDPNNLVNVVHLPVSSITKIKADVYGNIQAYIQELGGHQKKLSPNRIIHFAWNRIDGSLIGRGLLEPLLRKGLGYTWKKADGTLQTDYRPSYQEIMEEIEDSMRKVLRRYVPRFVYKFSGFTDDEVNTHARKIKSLRPEDDVIIGVPNKERQDIKVDRLTTDPRSRLDPFIEFFHNARYTALETPTLKLFLEAGFTEASARTAVQVLDRKVAAFQRFLKRRIEREIIKPKVMQEMGWSRETEWRKAEIRLNWGQIEKPKIDLNALIQLARISAETGIQYITPEELRKVLRELGFPIEVSE